MANEEPTIVAASKLAEKFIDVAEGCDYRCVLGAVAVALDVFITAEHSDDGNAVADSVWADQTDELLEIVDAVRANRMMLESVMAWQLANRPSEPKATEIHKSARHKAMERWFGL